MSNAAEITKIGMFVEIDGKVYTVNLPQDRMRMLANMAAGLSDSQALPLVKMPDGTRFTTIGDLNNEL